MEKKSMAIYGLREADPRRDDEMERLLLDFIEKKGVAIFYFSDYNKFSWRVFNILNKLKKEHKQIETNFVLKDNVETYTKEPNLNLERKIICDFILYKDSFPRGYTDKEIIDMSDYVLLQELGKRVNKDYIKEYCLQIGKDLTIF